MYIRKDGDEDAFGHVSCSIGSWIVWLDIKELT
jgi:hypothetical protein